MKKHLLTIAIFAATAAFANAQSATKTQSATQIESAVKVYNSESIIFTDPRTPRFPLSDSEQVNHANYAKSKEVWIANNPEKYAEMNKPSGLTKEQAKEREAKVAGSK